MTEFVAGDTGSTLKVTCLDKNLNTPINLSGSTVAIKWEDSSGVLVSKAMTVNEAVNGICSYQFGANELYAPAMTFEVVITDAATKIISNIDLISVTVRPKLT